MRKCQVYHKSVIKSDSVAGVQFHFIKYIEMYAAWHVVMSTCTVFSRNTWISGTIQQAIFFSWFKFFYSFHLQEDFRRAYIYCFAAYRTHYCCEMCGLFVQCYQCFCGWVFHFFTFLCLYLALWLWCCWLIFKYSVSLRFEKDKRGANLQVPNCAMMPESRGRSPTASTLVWFFVSVTGNQLLFWVNFSPSAQIRQQPICCFLYVQFHFRMNKFAHKTPLYSLTNGVDVS